MMLRENHNDVESIAQLRRVELTHRRPHEIFNNEQKCIGHLHELRAMMREWRADGSC